MVVRRAVSRDDLERCIALRMEVFVAEQKVPVALEIDDDDSLAHHLLAEDERGAPIGTARVVAHGHYGKIGRVAVQKRARGTGAGLALMRAAIDVCGELGLREAVLDAQTYAIGFYERMGFIAEGPEFDDAGIPHRRMRRRI